jgi:hypothetical protein
VHKPVNDFLMPAMNTVEHADGEVGVLEMEVFQGANMLHKIKICHRVHREF